MRLKLRPNYNCIDFSFTVDKQNKVLIVDFKGKWVDDAYNNYMKKLKHFISLVNTDEYTLALRCSQFGISIPDLTLQIGPFMQVYKDAGFKHMRVITENPQKEFRRVMFKAGNKIGFTMEFCNSFYENQEVYV